MDYEYLFSISHIESMLSASTVFYGDNANVIIRKCGKVLLTSSGSIARPCHKTNWWSSKVCIFSRYSLLTAQLPHFFYLSFGKLRPHICPRVLSQMKKSEIH